MSLPVRYENTSARVTEATLPAVLDVLGQDSWEPYAAVPLSALGEPGVNEILVLLRRTIDE